MLDKIRKFSNLFDKIFVILFLGKICEANWKPVFSGDSWPFMSRESFESKSEPFFADSTGCLSRDSGDSKLPEALRVVDEVLCSHD